MKLNWRIFGASVQGTSHARSGAPCQDAHAYRLLPGGVAVLGVADGAGTAECSHQGAQAAVTAAVNALASALALEWPTGPADWQILLEAAFAQARAEIELLAAAQGLPARSFATTLLCAAAGERGLAVGQVGDGIAVACAHKAPLATEPEPAPGARDEWFLAAAPQRGEYANETNFVTQAEPAPPVEVHLYPEPVRALAVMTDGLLRLVLDLARNEPHAPFFQPLLAFASDVAGEAEGQAQLAAFLASERVCERTDDDKTLLLAASHPAPD